MLSVAQLRVVIFCIVCSSTPVRSLLAPKPKFDSLQHRNILMMKESRMAVDIAIPPEAFSVNVAKVNEKALISSIITASYMSIIVSVMALPVCLAAMSADLPFYGATTSTSYLSELISVATVAIMMGKSLLGPVTDLIGGDATMQITMAIITVLMYACATFGIYWIIINFVYASAWGAVSKTTRQKFGQGEWAKVLGLVAAGSRLGSLGSSLLYGGILRAGVDMVPARILKVVGVEAGLAAGAGSWRVVFKVAAAMQGAVFLFHFISEKFLLTKNKVVTNNPITIDKKAFQQKSDFNDSANLKNIPDSLPVKVPTTESIPQVLARISRDRRFWLMLAGKAALMTVGQFISFIPLYLNTGHHMSGSEAAAKSAYFALGSLVSSIFGSRVYQTISGKMQVKAITVCNWFGFLLPCLLMAHHYTGPMTLFSAFLLSPTAVLFILILWGMAWALPFYLPAGVLALTLGGVSHAALLTNMFDAVGFFASSIFSYYAMELGRQNQWVPVLLFLSAAGAIALGTMSQSMTLSLSPTGEVEKRKSD